MSTKPDNFEERDPEETARRRDAALLRALNTPHKRQAEMRVGKTRSADKVGPLSAMYQEGTAATRKYRRQAV
jgi:hypothetical protein